MDWRLRLGGHLRALREARQLTQEQLAERVEVDPGHIANLERGKTAPSMASLLRLAEALAIPPSAILTALDSPAETPGGDRERADLLGVLRACSAAELRFLVDLLPVLRRHRGP